MIKIEEKVVKFKYKNVGSIAYFIIKRYLRDEPLFIKIVNNSEVEVMKFFVPEFHALIFRVTDPRNADIISPELFKLIKKIMDDIKKNIYEKYNDVPRLDHSKYKKEFVFEPMVIHKRAIENYFRIKKDNMRGAVLEGGVGTGKTFLSIYMSRIINNKYVIMVVPLPTLHQVWVKSLTGGIINTEDYWYSKSNKTYKGEKYIIVHYQAIDKLLSIKRYIRSSSITMIVDEYHSFNEMKSNRTNHLIEVVEKLDPNDLFLLSGTPIKFDYKEMFPQYRLIYKDFKGNNVDMYMTLKEMRKTCILRSGAKIRYALFRVKMERSDLKLPNFTEAVIEINLPNSNEYLISTIRKKAREYIERRLKEIEKDINTYNTLYFKLREKAFNSSNISKSEYNDYLRKVERVKKAALKNNLYKIYPLLAEVNRFEKRLIVFLDSEEKKVFREVKSIYKYPKLKVLGEAIGNVVTRARMDCFKDMSEHIDYDRIIKGAKNNKIITFSKFIEVADNIYTKNQHRAVPVYDEYTKDLANLVNKWKNDKKINMLVTTYKSLSTGVPLIESNTIIFIDLPFRDYEYQQARGRVHRLGQDKDVIFYTTHLNTDEPNISDSDISIITLSRESSLYLTDKKIPIDDIDPMYLKKEVFNNVMSNFSTFKDKSLNYKIQW
jgi:SNF2 family DNA or RNA helicase